MLGKKDRVERWRKEDRLTEYLIKSEEILRVDERWWCRVLESWGSLRKCVRYTHATTSRPRGGSHGPYDDDSGTPLVFHKKLYD